MTDIAFDISHREVYETFMDTGNIYAIQAYLTEETGHEELTRISFYQGYARNSIFMSYYMKEKTGSYQKLIHVKRIEGCMKQLYNLVDFEVNDMKITLEFEEKP